MQFDPTSHAISGITIHAANPVFSRPSIHDVHLHLNLSCKSGYLKSWTVKSMECEIRVA